MFKPRDPSIIVKKAREMVGCELKYNAVTNNCEDFATEMRYGQAESRQAPAEALRQGGPPRERRVPLAGAVAEVIREKGPTRVQSRRRRPPYPVPSNGPHSAPAGDTTPRSKRKKAPAPLTPIATCRFSPSTTPASTCKPSIHL
ncbi:unnamed protein product [Pleuronectes platessa]|uniref:LRAT domain-containing protein n=1 Tax=Pleuronectes platessa TaxID=8262 RepID=A0A9N7UZY5_PLEPL|nr:unnamed protein product [Pleuronectes platessa]